ncbi:hypothetical protein M758_UG010000 [Ceratodon purpureus]|nr:hypothetical protein M758_UG010000 [Ceratodon purpureus]
MLGFRSCSNRNPLRPILSPSTSLKPCHSLPPCFTKALSTPSHTESWTSQSPPPHSRTSSSQEFPAGLSQQHATTFPRSNTLQPLHLPNIEPRLPPFKSHQISSFPDRLPSTCSCLPTPTVDAAKN